MPQIRIRDAGGVLRTPSKVSVRDSEGTLRPITRIRMRDAGNVLRTVFQTAAPSGGDVALSDYDVFAVRTGKALTGIVTTTTITSTVGFGTGPYTYHWERLTGSTNVVAATPNNAQTYFGATPVSGSNKEATFRLKVTDSLAVVKYSDPISLEFEWRYG